MTNETKKEQENFTIEKAIAELENIVNKLESGDTDLDTSFTLFEKAVILSKGLRSRLASYERKIEIITNNLNDNENFETSSFDEESMTKRF